MFMAKPEEEQEVSGSHRLAQHQATPACGLCNPILLRHRALPGSPRAVLGLEVSFPVAPGGLWMEAGQFPRGRAHITSSGSGGGDGAAGGEAPLPAPLSPPQLSLRLLLRRRGPRIPGLFLGWPYQPSCPLCRRLPPH